MEIHAQLPLTLTLPTQSPLLTTLALTPSSQPGLSACRFIQMDSCARWSRKSPTCVEVVKKRYMSFYGNSYRFLLIFTVVLLILLPHFFIYWQRVPASPWKGELLVSLLLENYIAFLLFALFLCSSSSL